MATCSGTGSWAAFLNVYSLRTALVSVHGLDFEIPAHTIELIEPGTNTDAVNPHALVPVQPIQCANLPRNNQSEQIDSDSDDVQADSNSMQLNRERVVHPSQSHSQLSESQSQAVVPFAEACRALTPADASDPRSRVMSLLPLDHVELARLCVKKDDALKKRDEQIVKLRNELKRTRRSAHKNEQLAVKSKQLLDLQKLEGFMVCKLGKAKDGRAGRLSLGSMFSIGIRRCLTNVAALDFGILSMADISGQTVIRAEHRTASAIIYGMHCFFSEASEIALEQHRMFLSASDSCKKNHWSLTCVGFRTDATNSSVWRRKKIQVLECTGAFLSNEFTGAAGNSQRAMKYRRCV